MPSFSKKKITAENQKKTMYYGNYWTNIAATASQLARPKFLLLTLQSTSLLKSFGSLKKSVIPAMITGNWYMHYVRSTRKSWDMNHRSGINILRMTKKNVSQDVGEKKYGDEKRDGCFNGWLRDGQLSFVEHDHYHQRTANERQTLGSWHRRLLPFILCLWVMVNAWTASLNHGWQTTLT